MNLKSTTANGLNFWKINSLMEFCGVRLTWLDCKWTFFQSLPSLVLKLPSSFNCMEIVQSFCFLISECLNECLSDYYIFGQTNEETDVRCKPVNFIGAVTILFQLGPNVSVGSNVVIGAGARVRETILLDGAELKVYFVFMATARLYRGLVRVKFWQATSPWNSEIRNSEIKWWETMWRWVEIVTAKRTVTNTIVKCQQWLGILLNEQLVLKFRLGTITYMCTPLRGLHIHVATLLLSPCRNF